MRVGVVRRGRGAAGELQHQPGRDHHRDEEGEDHRGGGVGRDRAHVGAHHARDEEHRQQRGDHGERGDDGRVADLGHRLDRRLPAVAAVVHRPVAGDVLDHDDGVVDQDADREDQREQADAVERVAHEPRGEEREQDRGRDDDRHHERLAPADGEGDQGDDRDRGEAEMEEELVGLLVGGLAVVAGDRRRSMSAGIRLPCRLSSRCRIASATTTALVPARLAMASDTAGTRCAAPSAGLRRSTTARLAGVGGEADVGDVAHIDRPAVAGGEQQVADLRRGSAASRRRPASICSPSSRTRPAGKERLAPSTLAASCCSVMP